MLEKTEKLQALNRRWEGQAYGDLAFHQALARYAALWAEALVLRHDPGADWEEDLEADIAVARAVNGLPPS